MKKAGKRLKRKINENVIENMVSGGFGSVFSLFFWFGGSVRLVIVFIFSCVAWLHIFFAPFFFFFFCPFFVCCLQSVLFMLLVLRLVSKQQSNLQNYYFLMLWRCCKFRST